VSLFRLVHPNWWASYTVYAFPSKTRKEAISLEYDQVGYRGPNLGDQCIGIANDDESCHFEILPAHESVVNWDVADLQLISPSLCQTATERDSSRHTIFGGSATSTEPFLLGMSQTSVIFDGDSDRSESKLDRSNYAEPTSPDTSHDSRQHMSSLPDVSAPTTKLTLAAVDLVKQTRIW
jgi:hypothetical protein